MASFQPSHEKGDRMGQRHSISRSTNFGLALLAFLVWGSAVLLKSISAFVEPPQIIVSPVTSQSSKVFPNSEISTSRQNLTFDDVRSGTFRPNLKEVQWIHSPESVTNDQGTYLLTDKVDGTTNYVVKSILDESYHYTLFSDSKFKSNGIEYDIDALVASPDLSKAVLKTNTTKGWRHSSEALYWVLDVKTAQIEPLKDTLEKVSVTSWAPTSDSLAFIHKNDIYVKNLNSGNITRITDDGSENIFNGKPDWVYEEEVFASDITLWWSPQGDKIAFIKFNDTLVPEFTIPYYVQNGHEDYPELITIKYPKPGYPNPTAELLVAQLSDGKATVHGATLDSDEIDEKLITEVLWVSDDYVLLKVTNRASDIREVFLVSAEKDAEVQRIRTDHAKDSWFEVTNNAVFVPKNKTLGRFTDGYVDLVVHEGYNHLAYFTPPQNPHGKLLTKGQWEVLSNHVDFQKNEVIFTSTLELSVQRHFYSVNLIDSPSSESVPAPRKITNGTSWYGGSLSSGSRFLLLNYLGPEVPAQTLVDLHTQATVKVIETNKDIREAVIKFELPKQVVSTVNLGFDEETGGDIIANSVEIFPPKFNASLQYPVLFYVYGGPGSQMVTNEFAVSFSQVVASELNAIVVTVDGRGTGYNNHNVKSGSRFKFCVRDRLGHFEPIDQIAAAKVWAERPYVDADRIAIWGWSYGGFLTLKTLETDTDHVFSYGVAVAPVTKWKLYDSIYTERYLRKPQDNPEGYETASIQNTENFKNVTRFLIMHGSGDDNVHFQNSLRLLDEFNLGGVENFDFMVFPDSDHLIRYHNGNTVVFDRILGWIRNAFSQAF